ncbi:MAG: endonuclease/exonuclease/phosphatase family protein [Gemmatimonadales bacterium]
MPPFPKPTVDYAYDLAVERRRLRAHRRARAMPRKGPGRLLVGSWNIANFGLQERRNDDLALIAELLSWFDVVAVQECRENFADLYQVVHLMGTKYQVLMSDAGGNNERLVFIYDRRKLGLLDEIGEVSIAPSRAKSVKLEPEGAPFVGFDRPPYLASFNLTGTPLSVQLVNVHLFFGSPGPADVARRALEVKAVARWAALRNQSPYAGARELIALGDFNMPKARRDGGNVVYDALTSRGLVTPGHSTVVGSSIASDNQYDQVAMFPKTTKAWLVDIGVFDFDAVVFKDLWAMGDVKQFQGYVRYYLSDHRPMWVELGVG